MNKVVIIGAGYAGIYALRELAKYKDIKITLIDKHSYHNLQPEVYDLIANKSNIADVTIDLTTLCIGLNHNYLEYKNLKVSNIDMKIKKVYTDEKEIIDFDYLVLALGTRTFFPQSIIGLNNTDDIKKLHRAIFFKQSFENSLFRKIADEVKKCDNTHIVVAGAGLSGVEIAAEMSYNSKKFFKRGSFSCDNFKVSLISSSDTILPGFSSKLISLAHNRLKTLGINVITNTKLEKSEDGYLFLSNGTKIYHSFLIFTGGITAPRLCENLDTKKNSKNQIIVNEYQQISAYENIFAIGDISEIRDKKNNIMPPNVTIAEISGITAGKNILNMIKKKKLDKCNPKIKGILIALGGKYAVGNIYNLFHVKGLLAYYIKKYVFLSYKKPLLKLIKNGYSHLKKY